MCVEEVAKAFYETPEFWSAVQAGAALGSVVAAVAAVKAARTSHKESGPMISVSMHPYLYSSTNHGPHSITEMNGSYSVERIGAPQIELVLVTVTNTGRTAATVNGVFLRVEGPGGIELSQTAREMPGSGRLDTTSFADGPVVIEPYSEKKVLLDFWGRMETLYSEHPDAEEFVVTGTANVTGVKLPVESQKHGQWVVKRGHRSFSGNHFSVRPIDVMANELAWKFRDLTVPDILIDQLKSAERQLQPKYHYSEVAAALTPWSVNERGSLKRESAILDINSAALQIQSKLGRLRGDGDLEDPPAKVESVKGEGK